MSFEEFKLQLEVHHISTFERDIFVRKQYKIYLENFLDDLCKKADRNIFIMLPVKYEKQIDYLHNEIKKTANILK